MAGASAEEPEELLGVGRVGSISEPSAEESAVDAEEVHDWCESDSGVEAMCESECCATPLASDCKRCEYSHETDHSCDGTGSWVTV